VEEDGETEIKDMQVLFELVKSLPYLFKHEPDFQEFQVTTQKLTDSDEEMEEFTSIAHVPSPKKKNINKFEPMILEQDKENVNFQNLP